MDDEISTKSVSRRSALKKLGAGTAIVWTAPIVLSFDAPGFAASAPTACDCTGANDCVIGNCGGGACSCAVKTNGACACFVPACGGPVCSVDSDCGPGSACVANCCGVPVCAQLCGPTAKPPAGAKWR